MRLPAACLLLSAATALADDWPSWRGPRGDGTTAETRFPTRWSETENVRWKVPVPGRGHSSPVVHGDRVFLATCLEDAKERQLCCFDRRDGKPLWRKTVVTAPLEKIHKLNSHASSTPATDGRHVWVTFLAEPRVVVACYTVEGDEVWTASPGEFHSRHGFCSPPTLFEDLVIVNCDQDAVAYVVAFDKATGKERWRADRPNRTRSYCPPVVFEAAGRKQLALSGSKCVASYDPRTGEQIWLIDGPTEQFVASLVMHDGILCLTTGFPEYHLMGIRPDGTGNVTKTHVAWWHKHKAKGAGYVPSPVAHNGLFFNVSDEGICTAIEPTTGQRHFFERLGKHHSASPVAAGGLVYFTDDYGVTFVVKAARTFEVVAKNKLDDEVYASPALSRGDIFIRGARHLYCVGGGK